MLRMDQVHVIRHAVLKQGRSRRSVALELGVSRNTVRKYLEESEPRFSAPVGRRQPVRERVKARLDELLAEWSARTTAKQRNHRLPPPWSAAHGGLRCRDHVGKAVLPGVAATAPGDVRPAGSPTRRLGPGRLLRGHG